MKFEEKIVRVLVDKIIEIAKERNFNEEEAKRFVEDFVQGVFADGFKLMSDGMISRLVQQVPEMIEQERGLRAVFEQRLYVRWKQALDLFDATVILTREVGERFLKK